ncbi:quercetin dioxygenase-like cupin family protein [Streptomyces sp. B4I13]|uniref:cupin domain-containing protein n=1 Tax=Streptomyces sp. B4I13 TaxID=3042271 RepID=UPI002781695B|nr:cupin domain-containing protein [Streptomyces sp. B4I13]MDQ0957966.1 quercetin dioxygenase-like cupin family protein [Streptomyces sp. B4I13]
MHVADTESATRRRAPVADGPTAAPLTTATTSDQVAVIHLEIPPDGGMPEHDHGASQIVLIPVSGSVQVRHGQDVHTLGPGSAAHIDTGERVSLANLGTEPAIADGRGLAPGVRVPAGGVADRLKHRATVPAAGGSGIPAWR